MTKVIDGDKRRPGLAANAVDFAPLGLKSDYIFCFLKLLRYLAASIGVLISN
jgi:hypothetical protein